MNLLRGLLVTATLLFMGSAGSASAATYCGTFKDPDGARIAVRVINGDASCATAKRVLSGYARSIERQACTSSACPRTARGFRCSSATAASFPRLYSCASRSRRVAAYSTAS